MPVKGDKKYTSEFALSLTAHQYLAFSRFSRWLGREATKADITRESIERFAGSDFQKALTKRHQYNNLCTLRSLAGIKNLTIEGVENENRKKRYLVAIPTKGPSPTDDYDAGFDTSEEVNGEITLQAFFNKQYKPKRLIGKSQSIIRIYKTCFRKFSRWIGRPAVLSDLTDDTVAEYLYALSEVRSMHTVDREYTCIVALWRFAARKRLVDLFPEIPKPQGPAPIPDAWSPEELDKLLATAKEWDGNYSGVDAGLYWESLIRVIYDTGERIGAVLKIEKHHLADGWLSVPAMNRKGRLAGKQFKLSERTNDRLQQVAAKQLDRYLFQWPYSDCYLWIVYGQILEAAGLPNNRRTKLHKLRRTVATYYEAAGGNATQLLGHSSRKITEAYLDQRYVKTPQPCDIIKPL